MQATLKIASKCRFSLDELTYEYPKELVPSGYTAYKWLRELTQVGIHQRWPRGTSNKVLKTIEHELRLIKALNYEHYFLSSVIVLVSQKLILRGLKYYLRDFYPKSVMSLQTLTWILRIVDERKLSNIFTENTEGKELVL